MELVNEWFPTGKYRKVDMTDSTYEKYIMAALKLIGNAHHKAEMEYYETFWHTLGRIKHIALICIIEVCCATCCI